MLNSSQKLSRAAASDQLFISVIRKGCAEKVVVALLPNDLVVKMYRSSVNQWIRYLGRGYGTTVKTVETSVVERSMNRVMLLGRVGRDAEIRGGGDNPVALFPLATSETFRIKRDGDQDELKQRTSWHRINVFKPGLRDSVFTYCKKGSRVFVTGRINYSEFFNDSDQKIMTTNIIADDVIFVGSEPKLSDSDLQSE